MSTAPGPFRRGRSADGFGCLAGRYGQTGTGKTYTMEVRADQLGHRLVASAQKKHETRNAEESVRGGGFLALTELRRVAACVVLCEGYLVGYPYLPYPGVPTPSTRLQAVLHARSETDGRDTMRGWTKAWGRVPRTRCTAGTSTCRATAAMSAASPQSALAHVTFHGGLVCGG